MLGRIHGKSVTTLGYYSPFRGWFENQARVIMEQNHCGSTPHAPSADECFSANHLTHGDQHVHGPG
jgi:hypothetical protein